MKDGPADGIEVVGSFEGLGDGINEGL